MRYKKNLNKLLIKREIIGVFEILYIINLNKSMKEWVNNNHTCSTKLKLIKNY